jgi:hypothetical protein
MVSICDTNCSVETWRRIMVMHCKWYHDLQIDVQQRPRNIMSTALDRLDTTAQVGRKTGETPDMRRRSHCY